MQFFVGLKVFLTDELYDVVAEGHEEGFTYFVHFEGIGHVLELLDHLIGTNPGQHAATACRTHVLRHLLCQLGEVGAVLQGLIDRVNLHLGCGTLLFGGILIQANEDVGGLNELLAFEALDHIVVVGTDFLLLGAFGYEERTYLLVAILAELFLIAGECVEVVVEGGKHLEFVVDEEFGIFLDILLVDDAF